MGGASPQHSWEGWPWVVAGSGVGGWGGQVGAPATRAAGGLTRVCFSLFFPPVWDSGRAGGGGSNSCHTSGRWE